MSLISFQISIWQLATDYWQLFCYTAIFEVTMSNPPQPSIQLTNTPDYRESYANSVQVRVNVWDFFLIFGTCNSRTRLA